MTKAKKGKKSVSKTVQVILDSTIDTKEEYNRFVDMLMKYAKKHNLKNIIFHKE